MEINKDTNVADVTLAEIHTVLFNTEKEFSEAVKKGNLKDAIGLAKRYIELNNLLLKRSNYVRKNGNDVQSFAPVDPNKIVSEEVDLLKVQADVAETVEGIMGRGK